jgi:hypothetical protein
MSCLPFSRLSLEVLGLDDEEEVRFRMTRIARASSTGLVLRQLANSRKQSADLSGGMDGAV